VALLIENCGTPRNEAMLPAMVDLATEPTERAKALSAENRARLAEELLATLDPHHPHDPHDQDVKATWNVEIL